jgi:hypothetical protein
LWVSSGREAGVAEGPQPDSLHGRRFGCASPPHFEGSGKLVQLDQLGSLST